MHISWSDFMDCVNSLPVMSEAGGVKNDVTGNWKITKKMYQFGKSRIILIRLTFFIVQIY